MKKTKKKKGWEPLPLINFSTQENPDDNVPKYLENKPNVEDWQNHPVANYNLKDYIHDPIEKIYKRKLTDEKKTYS